MARPSINLICARCGGRIMRASREPGIPSTCMYTSGPANTSLSAVCARKVKSAHLVKRGTEVKFTQDDFQTKLIGLPEKGARFPNNHHRARMRVRAYAGYGLRPEE